MRHLFSWLLIFYGVAHVLPAKHHSIIPPIHRNVLHIRIPNAGLCEDDPGKHLILQSLKIGYVGSKIIMNVLFNLTKTFDISKVEAIIRRCRNLAEDKNCEYFQTWTFGREACFLMQQDHMLWSDFFLTFQPPLKCPIVKGIYHINNGSINGAEAQKTFGEAFERYVWRAKIKIFDPADLIVCFAFGAYAMRGKTPKS